jgi:NAD(P)-dependent dehydrogenase (short-subunit alcohol dehydrogenase family)
MTPNMQADRQLREMTCDPKDRRVLITDGRGPVGQAVAQALAAAGASIVFAGVADTWKPFPGEAKLRAMAQVEIVPLDLTDSQSVADLARDIGARVEILINTSEHVRPGSVVGQRGLVTAREEMEIRYFGLLRLAQSFGPILRARGADGPAPAVAFVNLIAIQALMNWPAFGTFSATEAACLSAAQGLRAELRPGGVKVLNIFHGPLETDWYQTVPPPKVATATLAKAVVAGLVDGVEDVFVGDVAEDIRARLAVNPKALERELEP